MWDLDNEEALAQSEFLIRADRRYYFSIPERYLGAFLIRTAKLLLASSCPSVCSRVSEQLPLDWFSLNLVLRWLLRKVVKKLHISLNSSKISVILYDDNTRWSILLIEYKGIRSSLTGFKEDYIVDNNVNYIVSEQQYKGSHCCVSIITLSFRYCWKLRVGRK